MKSKFERINRLPPYIFGEINSLKMKLRSEGRDIIDFGMGNPDMPTPLHIRQKLKEVVDKPGVGRYSVSKGINGLRKAQAKYYKKRFNVDLNPSSEIIVTIGSKEGLANLAQAITSRGDRILCPDPSYPVHPYGFMIAGAKLTPLRTFYNGQFDRNKFLSNIVNNLKKNNLLVRLMFAWFINSLANVFPMILFSFYITYVLGGNDSQRQVVLFYYFLFAIMGVPFWTYISKKFGKKKTWVISLILSAFFFIFVLFLSEGDIKFFIIISCITGFCLGADLIIPPSIQADVSDVHLNQCKEDISGILFSLITFFNKLSFALASVFVFTILGFLKFEANKEINLETKIFITCSYALIPIILKFLSSFILIGFKITENDLKKVQKKIYS